MELESLVRWEMANTIRRALRRKALPKPCCRKPENLTTHQERPDLVIRRCTVCGCRHFEATLDPGRFGITGGSL